MATAQLLVARLKARFPYLKILDVLSVRELTPEKILAAQLIISTIPLDAYKLGIHVIQVHPLLLPEDIDTITRWLT
jgi:mannitol operon transcriptional antiterminator